MAVANQLLAKASRVARLRRQAASPGSWYQLSMPIYAYSQAINGSDLGFKAQDEVKTLNVLVTRPRSERCSGAAGVVDVSRRSSVPRKSDV